ncbi:MAG: hypothetical protein ACHQ49_17710, partial [Elusimicrobiota bacterium]
VTSWNPRLSSRRLMALRILCYVQFYLISFLHHPPRLMALLRNFLFGRVVTKSDRALQALWRGLRRSRSLETDGSKASLTTPGNSVILDACAEAGRLRRS